MPSQSIDSKYTAPALDFREFQELALYHRNGFFENMGDYRTAMPMMPQFLSPLFGMMIGELAFTAYISASYPYAPEPSFLSLGAGRGFLDHDLIEHVTSDLFQLPDYEMHAKSIREDSTFIITDRSQNALSLLKEELSVN